ncbi:MAG: Holliday junction branch migration protein RuvA [Tissierellia bacterium]|nr:Holliday junction branch migration protein RuvA [Tissierellia bacterium]
MLDYLIGKIEEIEKDYIVLDVSDKGYRIFMSNNSISDLDPELDFNKIYTEMVVREDSITLFGFSQKNERDLYRMLITVSGIGPRIAIGILSGLRPETIIDSIANADSKMLMTAPGVGKKTAERMILELKDKVSSIGYIKSPTIKKDNSRINEAFEALQTLGYTKYEVEKAVKNTDLENLSVEDIIRTALKMLSK